MDIVFGFKFLDKPAALQKFGVWLIRAGCRLLGFDFEVRDGNTD